ncbi:MAG: hypothetical protein ABII07_02570 [Patescibacteria group bacterium]|nr:hypothetical protein [Patescibacteria group bacterium]
MNFPYKNPNELIDKIVADLSLDIKPEEIAKLKEDLYTLYAARLYALLKKYSPDGDVSLEDKEKILEIITSASAELIEEVKIEAAMFYEDMMHLYQVTEAYASKKG